MRDNNPPRTSLRIVKGADRPATEPDRPSLTIADVAKACGLPQPVIAQVVPRTWTAKGWMYTNAQLQEAVEIAMTWPRPDDQPKRPPEDPGAGRLGWTVPLSPAGDPD